MKLNGKVALITDRATRGAGRGSRFKSATADRVSTCANLST
jgi:hypothetical protein